MPTTLTTDDLSAISTIVDDIVEASKIQTAAGFAEVHEKINNLTLDVYGINTELGSIKTDIQNIKTDVEDIKTDVENIKDTVGRIENVQRAEVERVDTHSEAIKLIKYRLKMA